MQGGHGLDYELPGGTSSNTLSVASYGGGGGGGGGHVLWVSNKNDAYYTAICL